MRLQKYLAQSGVASRRAAEKLIAEGHVTVNGEKITQMGVQVEETDRVAVDGKVPFCWYLALMFLSDFNSRCFTFG